MPQKIHDNTGQLSKPIATWPADLVYGSLYPAGEGREFFWKSGIHIERYMVIKPSPQSEIINAFQVYKSLNSALHFYHHLQLFYLQFCTVTNKLMAQHFTVNERV